MSRRARSTTRTGQMHLCAICIHNGGGYHASTTSKQLTWMLEIPPESDTSAMLGGRARTWFCRSCIETTFETDAIFAERNRHLELRDPQWWTHPATDAQIAYLTGLMDQRQVPEEIQNEIEQNVENATKGQVSRWISLLDVAPWKPTTTDEAVRLGPRGIVH